MVLHARAASDVSENQDLGGGLGVGGSSLLVASGVILRREEEEEQRERRGDVVADVDDGFEHVELKSYRLEVGHGRGLMH